MNDVRLDGHGHERCWRCGSPSFSVLERFGTRARHLSASLLDRPDLRCERCGAHNKVGDAKLYAGPEDSRYGAEWAEEQRGDRGDVVDLDPRPAASEPALGDPAVSVPALLLGAILNEGLGR